ncbi:MAG: peptide deformylase [Ignavibacteria bacterium]|nr:peptide deformylase [Ignavibacteria bacterium]
MFNIMPEQLPIVTYGNKVLRKKTKPVTEISDDLIALIDNMFYTMHEADGVGLSAPQINENISVALVDISHDEKYKDVKPLILINPEILETHGESVYKEGCLSFPELRGDVNRPKKIYLRYYDLDMKEIKEEFDELQARVIQHEIDHLNGKLFIDYFTLDMLTESKLLLSNIKKRNIDTRYPILK